MGVRSKDYKDEKAYLHGILKFVREIKTDPEAYLDSWNLLDDIDLDTFVKGIEGLEKHILKTIETPLRQRGDIW